VEAVWLALIVAGGALLTTLLNGWQIRRGKTQDYERQDAVAAQAAEAARLLEQRQDAAEAATAKAAKDLRAANEQVARQAADAAAITNGKLEQIHELVNSTLTAQMEEAHGALMQQLVLMREVIALNTAAGRRPSQEALDAIGVIEHKVAELGARLSDRAKATVIADARVVPDKERRHVD
jgi:hypothetical protein